MGGGWGGFGEEKKIKKGEKKSEKRKEKRERKEGGQSKLSELALRGYLYKGRHLGALGAPRLDFKGFRVPPNHVSGSPGSSFVFGFRIQRIYCCTESQHGFHMHFSFSPCSAAVCAQHIRHPRRVLRAGLSVNPPIFSTMAFQKESEQLGRSGPLP